MNLLKKIILTILLLISTGFPFQVLHKTFNPIVVNSIAISLTTLIFLLDIKEILKFKHNSRIGIAALFFILFGLLRHFFLFPRNFQIYDFFFIAIGLNLLLEESSLKELIRFSAILIFPVSLLRLYDIPNDYILRSILVVLGFILGLIIPKLKIRLQFDLKLKQKTIFVLAIGMLTFTFFSLQFLTFDKGIKKSKRVLFDEAHGTIESALVDLTTDVQNSREPNHGRLVEFLRKAGYKVDFIKDEITKEKLQSIDVLVLNMSSKPYTLPEINAISDFVIKGGGLLIIGDHTNMSNLMSAFNPIIEKCGIVLRFDTIWLNNTKKGFLTYSNSPISFDLDEIYLSVGASVDTHYPAKPILLANYADYSDTGNPYNFQRAYLGNSTLDKTEKVGDLVLIASSTYGKGRVVVLPDSSYFQNSSIYQNCQLAYRLFDWLNRKNSKNFIFIFLSLLGGITLIILIARLKVDFFLILTYTYLISLILAISISNILNQISYPKSELKFLEKRILFDFSHNNEYGTYWMNRTHTDENIDSLITQTIRLGFWPFAKYIGKVTYKELKNRTCYVIVAPNKEFSKLELKGILRFVQGGGGLLIADGPRKGRSSDSIIEQFGLGLSKEPIGLLNPIVDTKSPALSVVMRLPQGDLRAEFLETQITKEIGWIRFVDPCEVKGGKGKPFAFIYGRPVATTLEYGKGKVVLIGDDKFFAEYVTESSLKGVLDINKLKLCWNILRYLVGE